MSAGLESSAVSLQLHHCDSLCFLWDYAGPVSQQLNELYSQVKMFFGGRVFFKIKKSPSRIRCVICLQNTEHYQFKRDLYAAKS